MFISGDERPNTEFRHGNDIAKELIKTLESSEGWKQLTDKQQQLIKASMITQVRAERGGTLADDKAIINTIHKGKQVRFISSGEDMVYVKNLTDAEEKSRIYRSSQEAVAKLLCQEAVQIIEQEYVPDKLKPYVPHDFFDAEYLPGNDFNAVISKIISFGFPSVVHICTNRNNPNESTQRDHTFIVLGTKGSDLIVWEKLTDNVPFNISTLDLVHSMYPDPAHEWGIRRLRSTQGEVETTKKNVR